MLTQIHISNLINFIKKYTHIYKLIKSEYKLTNMLHYKFVKKHLYITYFM
jgi:hypothetical protein